MEKKSKIIKAIEWVKRNRKSFFTTVISVLVVILGVVFVYVRIQMINMAASDKLDMATKVVANGNIEQGISIMDDLINTYKNSPSAYRAMIMKASYLIHEKKYDEAENMLKNYIQNAKPEVAKPLGYPLLISVYDDTNKLDQAIVTSQEFLSKYSNNYLAPSIMENMARLYELSDKKEDAMQVYQSIVDKFAGTSYADRANEKLK